MLSRCGSRANQHRRVAADHGLVPYGSAWPFSLYSRSSRRPCQRCLDRLPQFPGGSTENLPPPSESDPQFRPLSVLPCARGRRFRHRRRPQAALAAPETAVSRATRPRVSGCALRFGPRQAAQHSCDHPRLPHPRRQLWTVDVARRDRPREGPCPAWSASAAVVTTRRAYRAADGPVASRSSAR